MGLGFYATDELMDEIQRRSLGCLVAVVRAEEGGDLWRCEMKGSPILLGAMSAYLNCEIGKFLSCDAAGRNDERHDRLPCRKKRGHTGAA